jgi:hypothetical protein
MNPTDATNVHNFYPMSRMTTDGMGGRGFVTRFVEHVCRFPVRDKRVLTENGNNIVTSVVAPMVFRSDGHTLSRISV